MKFLKFTFFLAVIFSCSNNSQTEGSASTALKSNDTKISSPHLSAIIDGEEFEAMPLAIRTIKMSSLLTVTGSSESASAINITLKNFKGEGQYQLGFENLNSDKPVPNLITFSSQSENEELPSSWISEQGTVTITQVENNKLEGTFYATLKKTNNKDQRIEITKGVFKVE